MKLIATQILFFLSCHLFAQNFIEYQKTFNQIDDDILNENFSTAIERLDSIYNEYDFIYAKHCFKSLQICCKINDSLRSDKWLGKCFKQGVPYWIIEKNELTNKSLHYLTTKNTIQNFDSLYSIYKSSINLTIAKQVDSLIAIDQKFTKKVNEGFILFRHTIYELKWLKNNKEQFEIINNIIDKYGFPGEKLIGLPPSMEDSSKVSKNIILWTNLYDHRAYIMLIHYFSNPRNDINDKLYKNLLNGFIPAAQYGSINDFLAKYSKGKYGEFFYYNVWHKDSKKENIEKINIRRSLIGLNTYGEQQRNMVLFNENEKNNSANSIIIFE